MRGFHFGEVTEGDDGSWGEYALHLQCPWRLDGPAGVLTGHGDLWEHATLHPPPDDWSFETGDSLQDARLHAFLGGRDERTRSWVSTAPPGHFVVTGVDGTENGELTVALSGGYSLRVFPDTSRGEAWRLLTPQTEAPHFVFRSGNDSTNAHEA